MPLIPSNVTRSTDPSGDEIATFDNALGQKVQAAALVDGSGNHVGVSGNPLEVGGTVEVGTFPTEYPLPSAQVDTLTPQTNGLTNEELRATPVLVSVASLPLPSGAATETSLANVSAGTLLARFGTCDVDIASTTVTYVGKEDKDGAWMIQKIDTTSGTSIRYATVTNNGGYLTYSAAWAARASLSYDTYGVAF